jgi:2-dehydropantoate 2-reductase
VRFIVCGVGGIGGVIGGYLANAGYDVVFLSKPGPHIDAMQRNGLILVSRRGTWKIPVRIVTDASGIDPGFDDVLVLAVKCFQTEVATAQLGKRMDQDVPVFCAQNGVRNEEIVARTFRNVHGMLVTLGATRLTPGVVVHTMDGYLGIGAFPRGLTAIARETSAVLSRARLVVHTTEDIRRAKWHKLAENLNNATAGLTGLSARDTQINPEIRAWMADVWEEGARVLRAAGVDYGPLPGMPSIADRIEEYRRATGERARDESTDFEHYSSLYQDLYHQRGAVEAPWLNGEIVHLGRRAGVPTPYNDVLLELAGTMAVEREPPGKYSVSELRARVAAAWSGGTV